ncbi:PepSY domain-containing protein [Ancylobacter oerskovii]|uniref:PepSY domain-containing protein n=1 Tax=Ancylobacter oerskovii TaxID=459519 RepID=A0ABW4Z308_9HYPH|nr:PepSY domain-containing protein [Ancylobacter oerskovii]MBS7544813.1 PepSY domain-containing protein [Ancylobacter oerskovii]
MKRVFVATIAVALSAGLAVPVSLAVSGPALAQTANPAANPDPATPAVTTPEAPRPAEPAKGANSFTEAQATSRIEAKGFSNVTGLAKDKDGVWRGKAMRAGASHDVALDYQGNVFPN